MRRDEITFLLSALVFAFGCVVLMFGAILHDRYSYGTSYNSAMHMHIPAGIVMLLGGALAILGAVGIVTAVLRRI